VKGERGEASRNVRIVWRREALERLYEEVAGREQAYGGRPALQQFIRGDQYSVGGLFDKGRPLRIIAYHKLLTYPFDGGLTAKTITDRPTELLETSLAIFEALRYTGLGQMQFIRDVRDGRFKFLEINPRVWACIGLAKYAGVDLYTPYAALAAGSSIVPNLNYQTGVEYHRFSVEMRLVFERPAQLPRFLWDCLRPRVHSDFDWRDPGPHLPTMRALKTLFRKTPPDF
jgi:predicted ATP-grasp superfamily ATP-dependent carboligase